MKTEVIKGEIAEYQGRKDWKDAEGKPIQFPIKFEATADVYETLSEAKASENWPNDNDILKFVNTKSRNAARAAEYQKLTKGLKEQWENSDEYKRQQAIAGAIAYGMSQEQAEALYPVKK